jgi:nitrogen fixation NifU-like protein
MQDMYQELILDYYRHPRNHGTIEGADLQARDTNPLCGDEIEISAKVSGGKISEIKFGGKGCAISQAAASMLTEFVKGKPVEAVKDVTRDDVLGMLGIELSPARLKCAMLGLKVLKVGAYTYLGKKMPDAEKDEMDGM